MPTNKIVKVPQDHLPPQEESKKKKKAVKFCPFKKATDHEYKYSDETQTTLIQTASVENFRECIKEKCMAYAGGKCSLINKSN